ncbi:MAG: zinc ABC transporter substrate-binding protein [Candidatus Andersenbacteria bacterium]|nr:zinc ABC transporter substrate-binding protein [Candidatus Andersenbacteria bacterium]
MNIIQEIQNLNFSTEQYIVVGSGPMAVRGLKDSHDIDIVVTPELFEKCSQKGWEQMPWTYPGKEGQIYLKKGIVELYLDVNAGEFHPTFQELMSRADIIQDIPFASLEDIIQFKKAYNRPKHDADIEKIEEYLG